MSDLTSIVTINPAIQILILTEMWLHSSINNNIILLSNYTVFHNDRSLQKGGGVIIYCHNDLHPMIVPITTPYCIGNYVCVDLGTCIILGGYRPPTTNVTQFNQSIKEWIDILLFIAQKIKPHVYLFVLGIIIYQILTGLSVLVIIMFVMSFWPAFRC